MKLKNKVALVTGGSRGIGAAIVSKFAAEGAIVIFTYVTQKQKADALIKSIGEKVTAHQINSNDFAGLENLVEQVVKDYGQLDILVNNAGMFRYGKLGTPNYNIANFIDHFAVNVGGVVAAANAAAKVMSNGGRIINIGSIMADQTSMPGSGDYAATKAAIAAYTRSWAIDLGAKGITVNNVQPGPINTDMNSENAEHAEETKALIALHRYGQPAEVANLVSFLASEESSFITGASFNIDGGLSS